VCRTEGYLFNHRGAAGGGGGGRVVGRGEEREGRDDTQARRASMVTQGWTGRLGPVRVGHSSALIRLGTRDGSFLNRLTCNVLTWNQSGWLDGKFAR